MFLNIIWFLYLQWTRLKKKAHHPSRQLTAKSQKTPAAKRTPPARNRRRRLPKRVLLLLSEPLFLLLFPPAQQTRFASSAGSFSARLSKAMEPLSMVKIKQYKCFNQLQIVTIVLKKFRRRGPGLPGAESGGAHFQ